MDSVTLNVKTDAYSNRVLEVVKALYGLSNKSEAFNRIVHEFGPQMIEPELKEQFAKDVLEGTRTWERKHAFKRKTTLKELDGL